MELYLPWNDTWMDLPLLPNFTNDKGAVLKMSSPLLIFLPLAGHSYSLNLLGGASYDQDNLETMTDLVWHLKFHRGNHTYFWRQELDPLSMLGVCFVGSPIMPMFLRYDNGLHAFSCSWSTKQLHFFL